MMNSHRLQQDLLDSPNPNDPAQEPAFKCEQRHARVILLHHCVNAPFIRCYMEDRDAYHRKIKQQTAKCDGNCSPLLPRVPSRFRNHSSAIACAQHCQLMNSAQVRSHAAVNVALDNKLAAPLIVHFRRMPMELFCAPR